MPKRLYPDRPMTSSERQARWLGKIRDDAKLMRDALETISAMRTGEARRVAMFALAGLSSNPVPMTAVPKAAKVA